MSNIDLLIELEKKQKHEAYINKMTDYVNILTSIDRELKILEYRLFNNGLAEADISHIETYLAILYSLDNNIKTMISTHISNEPNKENRYNEEIKYQKYILGCIGDVGIRLYKILGSLKRTLGKYNNTTFIKDNSSLLHLVSTNNHSNQHIRKVSDDSYMYSCQFHIERTPSMRVNNNKNRLYCYGCGESLNIFEYLMLMEDISYSDAVLLLAEINKISVPENPFKATDEVVKKYTNYEALRRYERRVVSGEARARHKNKTLNNHLALAKFKQEKETIARIRKNKYIDIPSKGKKKVLVLDMPNF